MPKRFSNAHNQTVFGILCTLCGGILWGFSGMCAQLLTTTYSVPAAFITWVRMLCTGILLVGYLFLAQREKIIEILKNKKVVVSLMLYSLIGLFVVQTSYALATMYTSAGMATVIQSFSVIFLILYSCVHYRKAPTNVDVIATVMGITSVFLIATHGNLGGLAIPLLGLVWGLVDAASSAFYAQYPIHLLREYGVMPVLGIGMLLGGIYGLPIAQPWNIHVEWDVTSILAIVSMVLLGTFAAFFLFLEGVKRIGSVKATLIGLSEPVSASVFSWIFLHSQLTVIDLIGFTLMISMVIIVTLVKPKKLPHLKMHLVKKPS